MRLLLLICIIVSNYSLASAQQTTPSKEDLEGPDSLCYKKAYTMTLQIKKEGKNAKYKLENYFFTGFFGPKAQGDKNKLRLVNIGETRKLSVELNEVIYSGTDSAGNMTFFKINPNSEILKPITIDHCNSLSVNLNSNTSNFPIKNAEIVAVKLSIFYSEQLDCTDCKENKMELYFDFREDQGQ